MPEPAVVSAANTGNMCGAKRRPGLRADTARHMATTKSAADTAAAQVTAAEAAAHVATAHMAATHVATTHVTTATSAVAGRECAAHRKRERCCENCYQGEFLAHDIPTFGYVALHTS